MRQCRSLWRRSATPPASLDTWALPPLPRFPFLLIRAMAVLTPAPAAAGPSASGPACSLQRSGSLWQLGSEAQELTTAISQLAEQLETDDPEQRALALAASPHLS